MVDKFGTQILDIIQNEPEKLLLVEGVGKKRLETITQAWQDQKSIANVMVFLQDKGVSPAYAAKIYKKYKDESIAILQENPYKLTEIWGIGFKMADQIAQKIGISKTADTRIKAGIIYAISLATSAGHIYVELEELKKNVIKLLELDEQDAQDNNLILKNAFIHLYDKEIIKLINYNQLHYITLVQYYYSEFGVSQRLLALINSTSNITLDIDSIYTQLRFSDDSVTLNEDQQKGIITALQNKVTVITGGPGTGKTTLIKKLLQVLEKNKISYKLAAPTGRAAKRIIEGTGKNAVTIHRLLDFDVATMNFTHNEKNALKLDFLIIDESSMIDIFLANAICKAIPQNAHLVLIGDVDQLPSVGAGNFLCDVIESGKVPCVRLNQIFRQAQDSLIVVNAHRINNGEFPLQFLEDSKKDFFFLKEDPGCKEPRKGDWRPARLRIFDA